MILDLFEHAAAYHDAAVGVTAADSPPCMPQENCQRAIDIRSGNCYIPSQQLIPKEQAMATVETAPVHQRDKTITIEVNAHKVKMPAGRATGLEIKESAIKQGVKIQLNFVLQVQLPNGSAKVVGDDDKIPLSEHLAFTAIAADDNS